MLDINLFREDRGGNPELVRESQRRRFKKESLVDDVIKWDKDWRSVRYDLDCISKKRNELNGQLKEIKIKGRKPETNIDPDGSKEARIKQEKEVLAKDESQLKERLIGIEKERDAVLKSIGNVLHHTVPVFADEEHNRVERVWPETGERPPAPGKGLTHVDLLHMIGGVEYARGVSCAGSRGYYLMGPAVMLNMAVIQYSLRFLSERGYTPLQPPYFMDKDQMAKCAQLDDFDEQLYKVSGDGDKYLIATSEQPICVYHADEWVEERNLPRKFAGFSTNFRKEAGSHGRDQLGIFRVHQFDKIEQFCVTSPDDNASYEMLETMIHNAEEFYQTLGLTYQVISIVSGAMNDAASKKYDLEAWFPGASGGKGEYRELVSASNCTDYQSRKLETRCGIKKMGDTNKRYVHMLNSTLCATTRTICCILETYQTESGITVPEVLRPIMGMDEIPFVRDPPKIKLNKRAYERLILPDWRFAQRWHVELASVAAAAAVAVAKPDVAAAALAGRSWCGCSAAHL
ncbi:serine--tRNA ligase cytoplasmic [Gracilaria domingensis]|nr:serine--tRNA ligase cytoplasmic [Gracilaria domingensis]